MDWNTVIEKPKKKRFIPLKEYKLSTEDYAQGESAGSAFNSHAKKTYVARTGPSVKIDSGSGGSYIDQATFEEIKFELISHTCADGAKKARAIKDISQGELARKINVKVSLIHEIENGTAQYNADMINKIERATGCKIDRGRKKKRSKRRGI